MADVGQEHNEAYVIVLGLPCQKMLLLVSIENIWWLAP